MTRTTRPARARILSSCFALAALVGCALEGAESDEDLALDELIEEAEPIALGEDFDAREDSVSGPTYTPGGSTEVWAVRNAWSDTDTPEARQAGLSWGASTGLNWEHKYQAWVRNLRKIDGWMNTATYEVRTPWGKTMQSPRLDCADAVIWARATFASWYGLPFFLRGKMKPEGATRSVTVYAGHFGFITADGAPFSGVPEYRSKHGAQRDWNDGGVWASDATLRRMRLGSDDENSNLRQSATERTPGAGAYFDELYVNKRIGYFMMNLLPQFGTGNLADDANMHQVKGDMFLVGDALVHRWEGGHGHAQLVIRVDVDPVSTAERNIVTAQIADASQPRRQPLWHDADSSYGYFQSAVEVQNAERGGGIKRFRTPACSPSTGGRVSCTAAPYHPAAQILQSDVAALEQRVGRFEDHWRQYTTAERIGIAMADIDHARAALRTTPGSCARRTDRERAFGALRGATVEYLVEQGYSEQAAYEYVVDDLSVDRQVRTLEDYVFAELNYPNAKTCCWNETTPAMHAIVMAYNNDAQAEARVRGVCVEPSVFRAVNGDYAVFRDYASRIGRGSEWREWKENEACPQAHDNPTITDELEISYAAPWCDR